MVDAILRTEIATRLVLLLSGPSIEQLQVGLQLIGDILAGTEAQTQHLIDAGVIPALGCIVMSHAPREHEIIQRDAYWALSNITAGTKAQANTVFRTLVLRFPEIIRVITHGDNAMLRREALMVFANAFPRASWSKIDHLMETFQFVRVLCDVLRLGEMETIPVALEAIHRLLERAEQEGHLGRFIDALAEHDGFEMLGQLQRHAAVTVCEGSTRILSRWGGGRRW
jgi:hypothetical protein